MQYVHTYFDTRYMDDTLHCISRLL